MRHIVTDRVVWSVCLSVCRPVTVVSRAKTDEPIEIPFELWARVGSRNHIGLLGEGPDPPWKTAILGERGGPL